MVLRPTWHKIDHFRDVLLSQSLGEVLKKLNLTQQEGQHLLTGQRAANFRLLANQ